MWGLPVVGPTPVFFQRSPRQRVAPRGRGAGDQVAVGRTMVRMRILRVFGWLLVVAIAGAVTLVTAPALFGLEHTGPFAQMVAFRGALLVGSVVLTVISGLWFLTRSRWGRRAPGMSAALLVVFFVATLVNAAVLGTRGFVVSQHVTVETLATQDEADGQITAVVLNTKQSSVDYDAIADLITAAQADIVFLPETPLESAQAVAALLPAGWQVFPDRKQDSRDTSLLIAPDMGQFVSAGTPVLGAAAALSGDGAYSIIAAHPTAPAYPLLLSGPPALWDSVQSDRLDRWRAEIADAYSLCEQPNAGIVAGDFNSTADHGTMGCGWTDAAIEAGIGGLGTWPSSVSPLFAAPIDRVFVDPDRFTVVTGWVVDMPPSDHRAVIIRLEPVG